MEITKERKEKIEKLRSQLPFLNDYQKKSSNHELQKHCLYILKVFKNAEHGSSIKLPDDKLDLLIESVEKLKEFTENHPKEETDDDDDDDDNDDEDEDDTESEESEKMQIEVLPPPQSKRKTIDSEFAVVVRQNQSKSIESSDVAVIRRKSDTHKVLTHDFTPEPFIIRRKNETSISIKKLDHSIVTKAKANDSKTKANDSKVKANDSKTKANDSKTKANDSKVKANDSKTEINDSKTEDNDSKTEGNDSKTEGNDSKTESNDSKEGEEQPKNNSWRRKNPETRKLNELKRLHENIVKTDEPLPRRRAHKRSSRYEFNDSDENSPKRKSQTSSERNSINEKSGDEPSFTASDPNLLVVKKKTPVVPETTKKFIVIAPKKNLQDASEDPEIPSKKPKVSEGCLKPLKIPSKPSETSQIRLKPLALLKEPTEAPLKATKSFKQIVAQRALSNTLTSPKNPLSSLRFRSNSHAVSRDHLKTAIPKDPFEPIKISEKKSSENFRDYKKPSVEVRSRKLEPTEMRSIENEIKIIRELEIPQLKNKQVEEEKFKLKKIVMKLPLRTFRQNKTKKNKVKMIASKKTEINNDDDDDDEWEDLEDDIDSKQMQNMGFITAKNGIILQCLNCSFNSMQRFLFIAHVMENHLKAKWNGFCGICNEQKAKINSSKEDEFWHMFEKHVITNPEDSQKIVKKFTRDIGTMTLKECSPNKPIQRPPNQPKQFVPKVVPHVGKKMAFSQLNNMKQIELQANKSTNKVKEVEIKPSLNLRPWIANSSQKFFENVKNFSSPRALVSTYKCLVPDCEFFTDNSSGFELHLLKHLSMLVDIKYLTVCAYCDIVFEPTKNSIAQLIKHIQDVHCYNKFQCKYCFYRSTANFNVLTHLRVHHRSAHPVIIKLSNFKERNYEKEFEMMKKNLKFHVRPLKCATCKIEGEEKKFYVLTHFLNHLKAHEKNKEIIRAKCKKCDKLVDSADSLYSHVFECFENIALYQCVHCSFGSNSMDAMHQHLSNFHPSSLSMVCMRSDEDPIEKNALPSEVESTTLKFISLQVNKNIIFNLQDIERILKPKCDAVENKKENISNASTSGPQILNVFSKVNF